MKAFIETHGRPFIALLCAFLAWINVTVGVYLQAFLNKNIDVGTLLASAGILTGMATGYAGFSAFVKGKNADAGIISQEDLPGMTVEGKEITKPEEDEEA